MTSRCQRIPLSSRTRRRCSGLRRLRRRLWRLTDTLSGIPSPTHSEQKRPACGEGRQAVTRPTATSASHNAQLRWELEIRFDSDQVTAVPPDPAAFLSRVLDSDAIRETTGMYRRSPTAYGRETSARQMHYLRFLPSRVSAVLFDSWPINAIHLPADRTGIMQSHNVLAGATARQAATAGIRPIKIETLPGTSADFLSLILEIPEGISYFGPRPSRFASQVQEFERDLRAVIEIDQRSDGMNAIVAVTSEGRFPMARASSMLSELAPLPPCVEGASSICRPPHYRRT